MPGLGQDRTKPDLANLQGLVTYRYQQAHSAVALFRIRDPAGARAFLRSRLPGVPHGDQDPRLLSGPLLNFAFTWAGLRAMLADDPQLDIDGGRRELDVFFTDQTPDHPAVRDQLGFVDRSAPGTWWGGRFGPADIHVAIYGAFDDLDQASRTLADIRAAATSSGLEELRVAAFPNEALRGYRPDAGILHFGYRDGVTSPAVDWADERIDGTVNFREFLMGYPSDDYPVPPQRPGPWQDFARDGSFACLTWVYQDVAAFNRFLEANAALALGHAAPGFEREWLAAKLLGRWPDGSPLVRHPQCPPPEPDFDDDFGYHDDQDGHRCPLSAHVRVVNPRDQELTFPNQSRFPAGPPRLIRRGFSYGAKLEGLADDGVDRGIVGTFICARVNEQFYTVLRWMQKTDFGEGFFQEPYSGRMQDALFGSRGKPEADASLAIALEGRDALRVRLPDFITYKGVAVFFLPSLEGLSRLAR